MKSRLSSCLLCPFFVYRAPWFIADTAVNQKLILMLNIIGKVWVCPDGPYAFRHDVYWYLSTLDFWDVCVIRRSSSQVYAGCVHAILPHL